jgi:hypothetical protein
MKYFKACGKLSNLKMVNNQQIMELSQKKKE